MVKTPTMTSTMSSNAEITSDGLQQDSDLDSISNDFSIVTVPTADSMSGLEGFSNFNGSNMTLSQAQSDLSMEEMLLTIQQLLNENQELKQTVQRDHDAMKSQFEIMMNAKEQIELIMKDQMDKREQAKMCIEQLRNENNAVKDKMAQIQKEKIIDYELKLREMKDAVENQKILYHQLKADNDELLADCNQLKQSYDVVMTEKSELIADYAVLKIKFDELSRCKESEKEVASFDFVQASEFHQHSSDTSSGEVESAKITDSSVQTSSDSAEKSTAEENVTEYNNEQEMSFAEKSIKNLLTQIDVEQDNLSEKVFALENEILKNEQLTKRIEEQDEIIKQFSEQQTKIQNDEKYFENNLHDSERKFAMANSYLQKYKDRCDSLETWLNVYQGKLDTIKTEDTDVVLQLRGEVQNLRTTLEDEKRRSEEDKKQLVEERERNASLLREHMQLKDTWENMFHRDENQSSQTEAYHLLQLKSYQEREDSIHAKLVLLEEKLRNNEEELEASTVEILRLKTECENLPLLRAQLEVYRVDFEEERRCREQLHEEKEQLVKECTRHRQERRNGGNAETSQSTVRINGEDWTLEQPNAPEATEDEGNVISAEGSSYTCPKCNFMFDSFQPLLNHVNNCLDTD